MTVLVTSPPNTSPARVRTSTSSPTAPSPTLRRACANARTGTADRRRRAHRRQEPITTGCTRSNTPAPTAPSSAGTRLICGSTPTERSPSIPRLCSEATAATTSTARPASTANRRRRTTARSTTAARGRLRAQVSAGSSTRPAIPIAASSHAALGPLLCTGCRPTWSTIRATTHPTASAGMVTTAPCTARTVIRSLTVAPRARCSARSRSRRPTANRAALNSVISATVARLASENESTTHTSARAATN